jgi:endonuclease YncB( thermonuclease family)
MEMHILCLILALIGADDTRVQPDSYLDMQTGSMDDSNHMPIPDTVLSVERGDQITTKRLGRVQLLGLYSPEKDEPLYKEATSFTGSLIKGKEIEIEIDRKVPKDVSGSWRAVVYLPMPTERRCINREVVAAGFARVVVFPGSDANMVVWLSSEKLAKKARKGIWGLPPEEYEKIKKGMRQATGAE